MEPTVNDPCPSIVEVTVPVQEGFWGPLKLKDKVPEKLSVDVSSSNSVDNHLYAMINYVELGFTGGLSGEAMLVGRTQDCLQVERVEYLSNGKDTLSILPIMKKIANCSGEKNYLEVPVKFKPRAFANNKVLLFVRTMDGKSISSLIDKDL